MPTSVGTVGSFTPFQPFVGSGPSETARNPEDAPFNSAITPNQRLESGSYSKRGSFSLGRLKPGLTRFQNSAWVIDLMITPVFLSWTTTFMFVKSTTCLGPTAPVLS